MKLMMNVSNYYTFVQRKEGYRQEISYFCCSAEQRSPEELAALPIPTLTRLKLKSTSFFSLVSFSSKDNQFKLICPLDIVPIPVIVASLPVGGVVEHESLSFTSTVGERLNGFVV
jgi:hypothetical protein